MIAEDIRQGIEALTKKIFNEAGKNLVELKVAGHTNDIHIQIKADKPSGGITIGECVLLNKSLVAAINQEGLLTPGTFSLEVSSPGIEG